MRPLNDALGSSVLIVGHPRPDRAAFGADFARSFAEARSRCAERDYPVIVAPAAGAEGPGAALAFVESLAKDGHAPQLVLVGGDQDPESMRRLINQGGAFRALPSFEDPRFERAIQEALEEHALAKQNAKLLQLVREQNEKLTRLSSELEERVEKRERKLEEARAKLEVANDRLEALHRALVAVHRARSAPEMERLINDALGGALGLSWTRISAGARRAGAEAMREAQSRLFEVRAEPLSRGPELLGEISFARERGRPFARDEASFLQQVAEAVALAIDRLGKLEQSETLKLQWEATFDAVDEPVAIIRADRTIERTNRAFAQASGASPEAVIGRKCHEALFGRREPCEGCELGSNFRLAPARTSGGERATFQAFSQQVFSQQSLGRGGGDNGEGASYVNAYRDLTAQLRLESRLLESAKMAELGTIGSSIAHELNNPLGGMLSFIQLIKMDLKGDESNLWRWRDDVDEMEKGARRCRDIVQNLLGFARKSDPDADGDGDVDLAEAAAQAIKIAELQTRSMGIRLRLKADGPAVVRGQFNLIAQAIRFFLHDSIEAIAERAREERGLRFRGEIEISVEGAGERSSDHALLVIQDNGRALARPAGEARGDDADGETSPDKGLSAALEIVRAHGGRAAWIEPRGERATNADESLEPAPAAAFARAVKISFPQSPS